VDELDEIAGDAAWEEALFHLYNRVRDLARGTLIFATRHAPRKSLIQLPDLKSRLAAGLVVQVHELSDLDKIAVMCRWAEKRGLELSQVVGQFLLSRCGRNLHDLHALLDRLDNASWVLQRKLTIPFIKTVLDI
jgi:DnaA family protein